VIEQIRPETSIDRLRWYCKECEQVVHEAAFHCTNLGTQIKEVVNKFKDSEDLRKCQNCGEIATSAPVPPPTAPPAIRA
jgi:3-hydroxyanthranilate 3,4-dioxygenase